MTTTVVDLGCCDRPNGEVSVEPLIARFAPDAFYGFDPLLDGGELWDESKGVHRYRGPAHIELRRAAAWVYDGTIVLSRGDALDATALHHSARWNGDTEFVVPCFDFPQWLYDLVVSPDGPGDLIVKMDVEGAEFIILERMLERDLDLKVKLLLIEWHDRFLPDGAARRARVEPRLRCEVEPWQ